MTEEKLAKDILQERLEKIVQDIPQKRWKYYHIERVQNFIYHLQNIPSERTRERMAVKINDYLSLLEEKLKEGHNVHQLAKVLFPSIWQIAITYVDVLGFISKPIYFLRPVIGVVLYFLLKGCFGPWIALGCVTTLAIFTTIRSEMKIKARKYY